MIIDYYDLLVGNIKNKSLVKEPYRAEKDTDKIAREIFTIKSKTALNNLEVTNTAKSFYKAEPDLLYYISKEKSDEYFYVMKSGMHSELVPAKLLYMLKECFKQHGTYNMLFNFIPKNNIAEITADNYLAKESLSILDVIRDGFNKQFVPISKESTIVPNEDNFDVYIPKEDRILIIPPKLRKDFDNVNLEDIVMTKQGLSIHGTPLSTLGNYIGAYNCEYDYRNLI